MINLSAMALAELYSALQKLSVATRLTYAYGVHAGNMLAIVSCSSAIFDMPDGWIESAVAEVEKFIQENT